MTHEIITSKNTFYYYQLYIGNKEVTSEERASKLEAVQAFAHAIECNKKAHIKAWGQFIAHHHADDWQGDVREVILTLNTEE